MQAREITLQHQVQHVVGIAPIVFLAARCLASDFGRIAQPICMTQLGQHLFEPGAVTTGLKTDDYFACEPGIKRSHVIMLMTQLEAMNLTVGQVTVTNGLLTSMKINCDIYCHRAPPLLITNPTV